VSIENFVELIAGRGCECQWNHLCSGRVAWGWLWGL